jgi:hypothetical protein
LPQQNIKTYYIQYPDRLLLLTMQLLNSDAHGFYERWFRSSNTHYKTEEPDKEASYEHCYYESGVQHVAGYLARLTYVIDCPVDLRQLLRLVS